MSYYLPDEMVLDILQRLPVKSLVRFRCVSKSWNSLITSPAFIHSHLNRSIPNTPQHTIFIVRHCVSNPHRELEREPYKLFALDECGELDLPIKSCRLKNIRLIGSENGLMCFVEDKQFILWNPSIRKVVNLPEPCITTERYGRMPCNEAFGFDLRTNDYKIVRIAFPYSYSAMLGGPLVEVYSVSTGSWRISSATFPYSATVTDWYNSKACLKGSIHFAGHIRGYATVFSFDLRDELFRKMILPKGMVPLNTDIDIVTCVFKGSLSLLCYHKQATRRGCCSIWVMKEYGVVGSWVQQFTIDIAGGIENVLGFSKNGHIILEARKIGWPGYWEHFSYDPESQQATNLGMHDHTFWVDTYKENLVLLNQANDLGSESSVTKKRKNSKLNCALEEMIWHEQLWKEKMDRTLEDMKRQEQLLKEKLEDVKRKSEEVQRKISRQKNLKKKVESLARQFQVEMDSPERQLKEKMEYEVRELEEEIKQELQELKQELQELRRTLAT